VLSLPRSRRRSIEAMKTEIRVVIEHGGANLDVIVNSLIGTLRHTSLVQDVSVTVVGQEAKYEWRWPFVHPTEVK
jgi:hypothetical protein